MESLLEFECAVATARIIRTKATAFYSQEFGQLRAAILRRSAGVLTSRML
jgi:hypothetical protein